MEEYYLLAVDGIIWLLNSIARHPALWICSAAALLLIVHLIYKIGVADGMVKQAMKKPKSIWQEYLEACLLGIVIVAGGVYIAIIAAVVTVGALR